MGKVSEKYSIERNYISFGKSRSGLKLTTGDPIFLVAHEVGGNGDADAHFRYFNRHPRSASAHTFIDDTKILEIVPLEERAWHVQYQKPTDNQMFGEDANDGAIGVEMCRTEFEATYDKYVWYFAYLCRKFNLNPKDKIVSHKVLDPERRLDPQSWLVPNGVSWRDFVEDVEYYYDNWNNDIDKPYYYRVRKDWEDAKSQLGAFEILDNAKDVANENKGYSVFNEEGENIYNPHKPEPKPAPIKEEKSDNTLRVLKLQSPMLYGEDVRKVQEVVGAGIDGWYGQNTEAKVKAYQKSQGLVADGIVGVKTWEFIFNPKPVVDIPQPTLRLGMKSAEVKKLQEVLYNHSPRFDCKGIDSHYGLLTKDAVKRYQMYYGVTPYDGIYGKMTAAKLKETLK